MYVQLFWEKIYSSLSFRLYYNRTHASNLWKLCGPLIDLIKHSGFSIFKKLTLPVRVDILIF